MIAKVKLVKIVGAGNVTYEQTALDEYSKDMSFVNTVRPVCVVKPKNAGDVQKIVNLANKTLTPLVLEQFRSFYKNLFPGDLESDTDQPRNIPMAMKASFLEWLSAETGLKDYEITDSVGQTFEDLFIEIESEYGRVPAKNLDPRYIHLFLLNSK